MGLSGTLHTSRMKVFLISVLYLSAVAALPSQDRQSGCRVQSWKGDGFCDDINNVASCAFDGGDCCGSNVDRTYCSVCACLEPSTPTTAAPTGTAACATVPAWMKTAMASVTGLERIINGQQAPSPIPWQAHMRQGSPTGGFSFFLWRHNLRFNNHPDCCPLLSWKRSYCNQLFYCCWCNPCSGCRSTNLVCCINHST